MTFDLTLSSSDLLLLAPEIFLTIWLCVVLAVDFTFKRIDHENLAYLSVGGVIATLINLIWFDYTGVQGALFKDTFVLDGVAIFFKILVLISTALVLLASIDYVKSFKFFRGEYYFLVMMSALGMMFMASAQDLLSVFVTLEFSTFGFYVLVAYLREDQKSSEAGLKFFILGVFAAGLLAYGISLVYGETGTLVFSEMASAPGSIGLAIGFIMIFAALGFKIGAVPFHSWIPDTYQGAPTPVTAFLSIAPKGAALAILIRMFYVALATFKPTWVLLFVVASIVSMTYGNIVAIAQKNIKRLLAYSGIAQIGNVMIGLAAGTKRGSDAILFYLLTYLFANLGAFAVVIGVSNLIKSDEIEDYNGLNRRSPFLAAAMLLFLLSLAGVPPLAGFIGKTLYLRRGHRTGTLYAADRRADQHRHFHVLLPGRGQEDVHQRTPRSHAALGVRPAEGRHLRRHRRHPASRDLPQTLHRLGRRRHPDVLQFDCSHGHGPCRLDVPGRRLTPQNRP